MDNFFQLTAVLQHIDPLRYTPAGIPILEVVLQHESWQNENQAACKIKFTLPARIIGQNATVWQHQQGKTVTIRGFLTQKSQRNTYPMLRIQDIQEYKG